MKHGLIRFSIFIFSVICLQAWSPDAVLSQQKSARLNIPMMDKDLDIMESILDKLVSVDDYRRIHLTHNSTRGIFIPSYGVIFTIPAQNRAFDLLMENFRAFQPEDQLALIQHGKIRKSSIRKSNQQIQDEIVYFLQHYADAIRQLRGVDKVTVIYSNQTVLRSDKNWTTTPVILPGFTISANYDDILRLQTNKLSVDDFVNKVSVRTADIKQEKQPAMTIFINAMQTMLHSRSAETFDLRGPISPIQLEEFGTILSFEANFLSANSFEYIFSVEPESYLLAEGSQSTGSGVNVWTRFSHIDTVRTDVLKGAMQRFEDKIIRLITQYAPTLDLSQPSASLVLAVKINQFNPQIPSRIVYKVQNSDIGSYVDRKLNRDEFISQIERLKYYHVQ